MSRTPSIIVLASGNRSMKALPSFASCLLVCAGVIIAPPVKAVTTPKEAFGFNIGDDYCLVDCAASPALFYASLAVPFSDTTPNLKAYYQRLVKRPSYARALKEAEPFFSWVPLDTKPTLPEEARGAS